MKIFFKNTQIIIAESQISKVILDEIDAISNTIDDNISKEITIPKDVINSFKIKDTLNPDIWIKDKLNPKITKKLIKIANDFIKELALPKDLIVKDIIFTGSLANFNWSKYSDIDLHIILDFKKINTDKDFLKDYFRAQKGLWNQEHDITIFDFPVELYIQDANEKLIASAIYSVLNDKWILKPKHENFSIDKKLIKNKATKIINQLKDIRNDYKNKKYKLVVDKVKIVKSKIKQMRNAGLEKGGEFSLENIVFKVLRRTSFMDQLDSFKAKAYDKLMSVSETINEEQEITISDDDITKYFYTGEGIHDFENAAIFAKKYLNITLIKILGEGNFGAAYLTDKHTKLKFTRNRREFEFAKKNIGKKNDFMADYYYAKEITNGQYVILMEYVEELPLETKQKLKQLLDDIISRKDVDNTELKNRFDQIKQAIGNDGSDLLNVSNYGLKNGKIVTFDPVMEENSLNENKEWTKGGVLLIKGKKLDDGSQRLYATTTKNILELNRLKKDNSEGKEASMAILGNNIYRLSIHDGKLKVNGVDWSSPDNQLKALGLSKRDVVLNNDKTPMHWETLKYNDIAKAIKSSYGQILNIPNIKWVG